MSSAVVAGLIRASDKRLSALDDKTISILETEVFNSYKKLEAEIAKKWGDALDDATGKSKSYAESRARYLLTDVEKYLTLIRGTAARSISSSHYAVAITAEQTAVTELIVHYEPSLTTFTAVPQEVITVLSSSMANRLVTHSDDFIAKARTAIIEGMIKNAPFRATAKELQKATGTTLARAETVVRTESMTASDTVRKDRYKQANISYVQRIATMDVRVCGFCAQRAGSVYEADNAPQSLHPNDRCYNAPWKRTWYDLGLIDNKWIEEHYAETMAKFGGKLPTGPAPFESANGIVPPEPIWTPSGGFR